MAQVHPHQHRCGLSGEIDYSRAASDKPRIKCKVCERVWTPTQYGWKPYPMTRKAPA